MDQSIVIGKIVAPHGVRGDVRVIPLTDFPERFETLKHVFIDGQAFEIEHAKQHNKMINVKFRGLDTRNEIECLRGKLLQLARKDAVKLPQDQFYVFDIIGLEVYDVEGRHLGKVSDVLKTGSNDVYVVNCPDKRQLLVPALKQVVTAIDVAGGRITVQLQEEWE